MTQSRSTRPNPIEPRWILTFCFFAAGVFGGGVGTYLYVHAAIPETVKLHPAHGTFEYVNPTLATEPITGTGDYSTVSRELELALKGIIVDAERSGGVTESAVYFRDLEPGTFFSFNTNMQFSPGLLVKIPLLVSYYKLAETNPQILQEKLTAPITHFANPTLFATSSPLIPGERYGVDELLADMIKNSDETAAAMLFDHIDPTAEQEIFSDLGIDFNEDTTHLDYISLKRYALFFRTLYNATYLSPEYSDQALALLAESKNESFLSGPLPKDVHTVARTGGHVHAQNGTSVNEVYECDLVYYPQHNYLLCAVARGPELEKIKSFFSQLGGAVYENMRYRYSGL